MKRYTDLLTEMDQYKTKREGPFEKSQKKKLQQRLDTRTEYERAETREARRLANREKIERPEARRHAAAEPLTLKNVKDRAAAVARKRGGRDTKPGLGDYARGAASAKIKKEKQRFKTDPVTTTKKYVKPVINTAKKVAGAMKNTGGGVGTAGGGDSSDRSVKYQ